MASENFTPLNLTLISVYQKEDRERIDKFCEECTIPKDKTAYNNIIIVEPTHIVRMVVGYGFNRARLSYAYKLLRGKDLQTGITSEETREKNLAIFKESLNTVLDLNNWHAFLNILADDCFFFLKFFIHS